MCWFVIMIHGPAACCDACELRAWGGGIQPHASRSAEEPRPGRPGRAASVKAPADARDKQYYTLCWSQATSSMARRPAARSDRGSEEQSFPLERVERRTARTTIAHFLR